MDLGVLEKVDVDGYIYFFKFMAPTINNCIVVPGERYNEKLKSNDFVADFTDLL